MYRSIASNAFTFLIIGVLVVVVVLRWAQMQFDAPGPTEEVVVLEVAPGDGLGTVTDKLVDAGVIKSATIFRVGARYSGQEDQIKFADYEVPASASMRDVLELITSGRGISYQVTIPEGFTSWQVVERLKTVPELTGEIAELPPEGGVAPNTYGFSKGEDRSAVLERMTAAQVEILEEAWLVRDPETPLRSREEALILASIVEKETGLGEERPQVASVFINRLNRGMKLQTDPTVIYGITLGEGTLGRGLRRSELDAETPYNTYIIAGLPPTPIANPGKAAIEAVLNPASTPFIYFVADGTGGHAFAETLDQHNANVRNWRQIEAELAAEKEAETEAQ